MSADRINIFPSGGAQTLMKGERQYFHISLSISSTFRSRSSEGSSDRSQAPEEESRRVAAEVPEHPEENH